MIDAAVHLLLLVLLPPLLRGIINKTKALFAGRTGAPFLQPYYDIARLLRKGMVVSGSTTPVFLAAPAITLASVFAAGILLPMGASPSPVSFTGDFLLFAYLFALSRFFTTTAALDTGSAFEGMGAAREVSFAVLTESALFFAFLALSRISGALTLNGMLHSGAANAWPAVGAAPLVMVVVGLYIVFLAECSRIPVDDPATHLELTMILDHSGPLLGLIEYAAALKLFVLGSLLVDLCLPPSSLPSWLCWLSFIAATALLSFATGVLESVIGRLRMRRVPSLLIAAVLLCGSAFIMLVR